MARRGLDENERGALLRKGPERKRMKPLGKGGPLPTYGSKKKRTTKKKRTAGKMGKMGKTGTKKSTRTKSKSTPTLTASGFQYGKSKVMGKARPGYAGKVAGMRAVDRVRKMLRKNFPERTMGTQSTRSKPKRKR